MVISRSDAKRRRREGDNLEDTLQGSPKRTKVHAQRKFAQGSSNLSSPALTPVKDKEKVKTNGTVLSPEEKVKTNGTVLSPELIPSKRPKTEDFLTFLCFRGTPILPPQLDFFNVATVPENQDEEQGSSQGDCSSSRVAAVMSAGHKLHRSASTEQSVASSVVKRSDRLRSNAKKKPTTAVQAIRKKYQEQRLAKQRARTLTTLAHKVKSKSVIQTRSSTVSEETRPLTIHKLKAKKQIIKKRSGKIIQTTKKLKTLKYMPLRRISARGRRKARRDLRHHPIRRGGLRSGGQLPPGSEEGLKKEKVQHVRTSLKEKKDKNETNVFASSLSDFSSDDDQPLVKRTRPLEQSAKQKLARKVIKRIVKGSRKVHPHMVTRSKQQTPNPVTATKVSTRPTRKTKEAAALYMELLGKKLITPEAEADEDSLSIDSFPELPNSRRNEQRENEMKARLNKEKNMKLQKLESQMKKDAKKDVPAQKKDSILLKKGGQIHKDDPKKENAEKLKTEKISGSPSGSEEGKRRLIRPKKEKERKLREVEKVEDTKEKVVKLKDSNKSDDSQGRVMRSMDLDKSGGKGKVSKSKDIEGKGNMNKHKESSRIEEIKGRPVRHKGISIKHEDVAVDDNKLKETDRVEEPKGRTRPRENEEVKRLLKSKVVSRSEAVKKRVKRYKEIEKTNGIKSKLVKSKENNEMEGTRNTDKLGDVEESSGRIVKSKESDSSAVENSEKVDEGKGRMTKVKEMEKSQEAKERRTTEKSEDGKPKFVKASIGSKQEENKIKVKSDDKVEELKGRSGKNKETDRVQELKGRTKLKEVDEIESTKGKVADKIEPAKGKVTKLKDNESIKGRTMRTREMDESKAGSANTKELENNDDSVHKVSQETGGVKSSKMPRTHEDEKGKQKAAFKTRVNRKDANVDVPVPKKLKGPKAPLNKRSPAIKKKSVDSEDDNWEDEGEEDDVDDGMKPPIPPRRSLRRGSHDQSQPGSESLDSLTGEAATTRSSSRRSSSHSSLSPVGRQIQNSSKSRDSSEDKFSDSDEEPLGKIALKNSSASQKSNDSREEKKHGKDQGADSKKQPSKDTSESDDNIQGMNSKNKGTKKFLKTKPNSTKILSKPLGEKVVIGKSKSVKTMRESDATEDNSEKKRPLNSDSKELQVLNKSKNLAGCSKSTGENERFEHDSKKKSALDGKVDESYLSHPIPGDNANDDSSPESGRDSEVNRCEKIVHPILDEDHNTNVIPSKGKDKIPGTKSSTVLCKKNEQSEKVDTRSSETNSDIPGATKNVPFPDSEKKSTSSTGEKEGTQGLLSSEKDHSNDGSLTSPVELKTSDKASLLVEKSDGFATSPESKKSDKSSVSLVAKKLNKRLSFSPERKKIPDRSCASSEKMSSKRVSSSPEEKKIEVKKTGKRLTSSPEGKMLAEKVLVSSEQKKSNKSLSSPHGKKLVNKPPLSPEGKNVNKAYCSDGKKTEKSAISSDEKQSLKGLSSPECTKSANKPSSGEKVNRRLTSSPECKKLDDTQHLSLEEGKSQKNLFPSPELKKSSDSSSQSSDKLPLSLYDKSPSDNFPSKDSELCSERPATSDDGYSTDKLCSPSENDGGKLSHLPVVKKTTLQMDKFLASSDGKKTADILSEENKSNSELSLLSGKKLDEMSSLLPEESESSSKLSPLFDGSKSSNTFSILSKETNLSQFSSTLKESKTSSKLPPSSDKLADSICLQSEGHKSISSSKKSSDSTSQSFEESNLANKSPEKRKLSNKLLSIGEKKPVPQNKTVGDQLPVSEISSNNIPEFNEGKRLSGNSLEERISTAENQLVGSKSYSPCANQEERKQSLSEGKNLANRLSLSPEGKRSGITIPFSPNKISVVPKESKPASRSFSLAVDDKSSDESVLNTEGIPADGKSSERRITDAKELMKNLPVNKLSILSEAEKLMPELPSTSAEESNTLSESSLGSIAKKLTPIIPSEKKRLTQKISLLNNLKILSNSDMDKESDRNSFISNYTFPPLKGDVAHDSNSSEIKPRNFYDKNLKDLKSSVLEKKEKCNDTLSILQKSESSFPNSDEGNNSKPEGGHLIVPHKPKKQGGRQGEDPLSVHKLPAGKSAVGLDPEVRKVSRSNLQRREGNTSKKSEGLRKSSMACPKETELELRRRLSMVCLKETDSEPSIESGCEGETRGRSSFMIEKESCLRETTQEPTTLTGKVTCQGETGQESSSVIEKELSKEQNLDLKDSDKIPCPGESEVERHKRLIQKAKEELEQRLNSRDVGDVFKLTSSKMSKKHCSEKVVNTTGNVAKHGKFHDPAKKLNQDIPKGSKNLGGAKLTSWTERSQKSVASHNSAGQSESCESQKPSETENERKMLHGPEMMSKGKVDSITTQDREPREVRTSNAIFPENLMSVLAKPSDSVVDCTLNKRKLIETNDSPDISKSYNLLGELRTHDQLGSILNFYSSQEINVPNINPVQTEEIQSNHFKNVGKQLQGSLVQVDPSAESFSVQTTNFEEAAERPVITTVIQDDRVNQRLFFCKEPVLQEGVTKVQNFMANLTNEVLYHRQLNPVHVSARERSLDIISAPSCSQSIVNVHPPKDLSTLGDCKKGRVNERIEKWLSESCSGSLVHKKDCSMIDGSSCKCGVAVSDEEMLLSELPGERLTSDGISSSNDLEESTPRLAKVGCPLLLSDVTGERMYQSEKISALRLDDFKRTLGSECVDKTENKRIAEQTGSSIPATCSTSNVPVDEVQKTSSLNFMLSSIAQNSIISPATDIIHSTVPWQNMKGFSVKNSSTSHEMQGIAVEHAATLPATDSCDISARKEELYIDRGKNLELVPVLPDLTTQELVKEQVYNQEHSLVEDLSEKSKVSLSSEQISKKVLDSSKIETCYNPRTGGKPVQISDRTAEKKSIFQQRRSFLHKTKERKDLTPSANAFSPENESSVYAFETEPESPPVSTPFRSRARDSRTSSTTTSKSEEDLAKLGEEEISSPAVVSLPPPVTVQIIQAEKPVMCVAVQSSPTCILPQTCTTSTQSVTSPVASSRTSTSIAVQVNLDSESGLDSSPQGTLPPETALPEPAQRSMECSTQTEVTEEDDDESEGHLFYIPLQQAPTPSQQLIQGVAVKLGTEGPTGPNQRVIMRAKLVTKAPNFSRTSGTAQDGALGMRRSVLGHQHQRPTSMLMMEQKSSYYNSIGMSSPSSSGTYPPVGTVQPTARSRPSTETTSQLRSDATTGTSDSDLKNISSDTELKQPGTKTSKVVPKQGSSVKEKTTEMDSPGPSTSCSTAVTPVKSSATKASKEKSSAVQTSPSTTGKGGSGVKRNFQKGKGSRALDGSCTPTNITTFPSLDSSPQLVEAPTFHPSEKEFQDPLEFIDRIRPVAEKFGLCRVVPPSNFKPECKVTDDMRFTAYNQYVHKMLHRWGPNVMEMMAIRKYLATQGIPFTHPPWIGGMEVDLPRLYQTVQSFGGLKEVIEKKRWQRVADSMKIPKSAQDRVTKLDDIYCKYLLPYDTLSPDERQKLFDEVETEWALRESRITSQLTGTTVENPEEDDTGDENEECIVKGRNMPLNAFYRIARNTMSMWFRQPEPSASEVEQEFWRHVTTRTSHVCVHSGSIDSSGWGYGFPCSKNSPFARHPWNLKVLTNNSGSVLRSMGPIMGVTVPTLHVGMVFTTCCWYRDPHGLPWIEYLHTGASKIWYGIPDTYSSAFRTAMSKLVPKYCRNKTIWLPSDTAMVPPSLLVKHGVSLCHTVQEPGQFIVVFPRAFTSSICTGYLVSESVYFAQPSWLTTAEQVFKDIQNSCEPSMFSLERLLFSIASDTRSHVEVLRQVLPMILRIRQQELDYRKQLYNLGLKTSERLPLPEANVKRRKLRPALEEECDYECEMCRANLFVSLVTNSHEEGVYCLPHAIDLLTKKRHHLKYCKLMYTYDQAELNELIQKLQDRIEVKSQKRSQNKYSVAALK